MSALGQRTLIQHLVDPDSMEVIAREGLDPACVPTEELRKVYVFALDYYHASGRTKAPSPGVLMAEYGDTLSDHEVPLDEEPDDSVEWAIDDLKGGFAFKESATFAKRFTAEIADSDNQDRVAVIGEYASELVSLSMRLESRESKVDAREAMATRLQAYEARAADREAVYGMRLGLALFDNYSRGIHDGELAVLAAGPKTGKSYMLDRVAVQEWRAGRTTVLYTLENSVEMTLDRIACLATGVDARRWQHGEAEDHEVELVRGLMEEFEASDTPLHVIQPEPGTRTVQAMVRQAQLLGAQSLLLDQLTFIEPRDERAPRHLQIREITHDLKSMISTGRDRMACLLAHQINREGVKAADKTGYLEMFHLAEGSEVERTADWVLGLYRSAAQVGADQATLQTLACRREETKNFQLRWNINSGVIRALQEINLDGSPVRQPGSEGPA